MRCNEIKNRIITKAGLVNNDENSLGKSAYYWTADVHLHSPSFLMRWRIVFNSLMQEFDGFMLHRIHSLLENEDCGANTHGYKVEVCFRAMSCR